MDWCRMFGRVQSLHSDRTLARARLLRSDRAGRAQRSSGTRARSLRSDRALARAWSLRSDRVGRTFGRYAAADIGPDLVAT
ncbi:hypothetical protein F2Q69_00054341 [Brassica cretica]|uniref:Uncharacterized protein n=1 Tax=Brassica cretica TaxID=69181 RepID=A0A8S9MM85_BRACR|nr:hypothetical protein F2Q69_00054341 [Brassica cretica]